MSRMLTEEFRIWLLLTLGSARMSHARVAKAQALLCLSGSETVSLAFFSSAKLVSVSWLGSQELKTPSMYKSFRRFKWCWDHKA